MIIEIIKISILTFVLFVQSYKMLQILKYEVKKEAYYTNLGLLTQLFLGIIVCLLVQEILYLFQMKAKDITPIILTYLMLIISRDNFAFYYKIYKNRKIMSINQMMIGIIVIGIIINLNNELYYFVQLIIRIFNLVGAVFYGHKSVKLLQANNEKDNGIYLFWLICLTMLVSSLITFVINYVDNTSYNIYYSITRYINIFNFFLFIAIYFVYFIFNKEFNLLKKEKKNEQK